ncbi:mercury transporter [Clostridium cadaveris]|uniref:mercury transporter n=1 Tax=Clostridium cadaveris TaxID=1529 RepID=UPI0015B57CED|nr:mercury transporter [Clostridium cadaveris]
MDLVKEMVDAFMILIRVGAGFRIIYCFVRMGASEEEGAMYKKRAKNTIFFYIIAECIWQLKELVLDYYV